MEQVVLRLPENAAQILEEQFSNLFDVVLFTLVDQEKNGIGSAESVRPLVHFQSILQLNLADIEQLAGALVVLEQHRVRDLVLLILLNLLRSLARFLYVLEVLVEGLRDSHEFFLALVLVAELEEFGGTLIVLLHHAAVLSQSIQDDQLRLNEELNTWPQGVLLDQDIDVAVGKQNKLLG